jgi:hypothetical protein
VFFSFMVDAVKKVARDAGLFLIVASAGRTADEERAAVNGLLSRSVRGLMIVPSRPAYGEEAFPIGLGGVPVVFVDRPPYGFAADALVIDNEATARHAAEHLIAHSHSRIAFVGTDLDETPVNLRLAVYPDTIRSFKVDVVEALSPAANAVLRDPEFGVPAVRDAEVTAPACATLVAEIVEIIPGGGRGLRSRGGPPSVIETLLYPLPNEQPLPLRRRGDLIAESARIVSETQPDLLKLEYPGDARGCQAVAEWAVHSLGGTIAAEPSLASRTGALAINGRRWWPEVIQ